MPRATLGDLKKIREFLGKSQSELGLLLGVSTRAIQSYEQGWRTAPPHVLRSVAMLLFLNWRKSQTWMAPCWDVRKCGPEKKECCAAWQLRAGDVCWLVNGTQCGDPHGRDWETKMDHCMKCPVTTRWLSA
jgi:DNA-binding XRE family transcriptional regulator